MISKEHRFRHRFSVRGAYRGAKTVRNNSISLKYNSNPNHPWRATVVVSRKVNKSAVVRNKIRRRIYAYLESNSNRIKPAHDLILSVFDDKLANIDYLDIKSDLDDLFTKANLFLTD